MVRLESIFSAFMAAVLLSATGLGAGEHDGHGAPPEDKAPKEETKDKAAIEKQKPAYPLKTCVVSGRKLDGDMGAAIDYVHQGRLVRFCCEGCVGKFENNPDDYLKRIDKAAKPAQSDPPGPKSAPKSSLQNGDARPKRKDGSQGHSSHGGGDGDAGAGHGCCGG